MAKSKAQLKAEFVELGGDPHAIPEDLENITAKEIEDLIEALAEANKLKEQLAGSGDGAGANPQDKSEAGDEPPAANSDKEPAAPEAPKAPTTNNDQEGQTFTLTGSASWSSAALPGKLYKAGLPFTPETDTEAAILRRCGRFKVEG